MTGAAERRLKRRLLGELVAENLALRRGTALRRRRGGGLRRAALRLGALVLLPAGLVAGPYLASQPPAESAAAAPPPNAGPAVAGDDGEAAAAEPASERAFPAPKPVDSTVFPLAVERVVLDPGHGGSSPGTLTPSGLTEKEITLDVARRLRRLLEAQSFEVLLTRERDVEVSLEERTRFANRSGADLFVSLHVNWIANRGVRGVETYFLGQTDDPFLTQLAAAENRGSGYSLTDMRELLEEIYTGVRQEQSQRLAESVQHSLFGSLRTVNPALEDRGVKSAPFIVLMKTEMPAILAEVSCLSNEREAALLAKPLYREFIAEAVAAGIRAYAEQLSNPDPGGISS